jgi:hypothetical protein
MRGQCQSLDKNHQYFQLFHCQQTQSLLITLYLLPYRGFLNVHEKNMEKNVSDKKINYFYYYY